MSDVKGVILNGAKYENQDTEARNLAGQAINQVETLENTVTDLESGFTNLGETVATVNQTATEAKTTANEANTLAQQAETRAQEAYELADTIGHQVGLFPGTLSIDVGSSYTLSDTEMKNLIPFFYEGKADGKCFLLEIKAYGTRNNDKSGYILFGVDNSFLSFKASFIQNVSVSYINGHFEVSNGADTSVTVMLVAFMQP